MRSSILFFGSALLIAHSAFAQLQNYTVLYQFSVEDGGPMCPLVETSPGVFVGGTIETLFSITSAGVFTNLNTFGSDPSVGSGAAPGVIQGSTGLLYGATYGGGPGGGGAIYQSDLTGKVTAVNTQVYQSSPLTEGLDGNFYGITGSPSGDYSFFRMTPSGALTLLYDLGPQAAIGNQLLLADDGNFYGATPLTMGEHGVVYRLTPDGKYTVMHEFPVSGAVANPLMQASNGLIYSAFDGALRCGTPDHGNGIFTLSLRGEYKVILTFADCFGFGGDVTSGLVEASDGYLYGFDQAQNELLGGDPFVFRMSLDGSAFNHVVTLDLYVGSGPYTFGPAFIQGSDGNFYLTNQNGGSTDAYQGTILELEPGLPAPLPRVAIFEPKSGEPGTPVRIKGSHLVGLSAVSFNGTAAEFVSEGNGYGNAIVPAGATSGPIAVTTMNGSATSKTPFLVQ